MLEAVGPRIIIMEQSLHICTLHKPLNLLKHPISLSSSFPPHLHLATRDTSPTPPSPNILPSKLAAVCRMGRRSPQGGATLLQHQEEERSLKPVPKSCLPPCLPACPLPPWPAARSPLYRAPVGARSLTRSHPCCDPRRPQRVLRQQLIIRDHVRMLQRERDRELLRGMILTERG